MCYWGIHCLQELYFGFFFELKKKKKDNPHTQNKAKKKKRKTQKPSIIKNSQSLVFMKLGNVQTSVWGEKSCNCCWCWIAVGWEWLSAVQLHLRGATWPSTAPSVWCILFWLSPLSLVPVVLQSWLHTSCGCMNHAVAVTWNLPGFAYLPQLLLFELLPPIQVYSSVRLFYYRVIQEKLNLPFPFFVNEAGSSET